MDSFRENLSRLMEREGLNQVSLSKTSGVDQGSISAYVNGSKKSKMPSVKNLVALAKALKCTVEELTGVSIDNITEDEQEILDAYNKLPDDDPRKKLVNDILFGGAGHTAVLEFLKNDYAQNSNQQSTNSKTFKPKNEKGDKSKGGRTRKKVI